VNIETVVSYVSLSVYKPFEEWLLRIIENFIPFLKPMEIACFLFPKSQIIFFSRIIKLLAFCICTVDYFFGRIVNITG